MEVKSRKSVTQPAGAVAGAAAAGSAVEEIGGAEAAVNILNAEDDDGADDAPLPDPFDYDTDSDE